jgi:argininosuccinate lyase
MTTKLWGGRFMQATHQQTENFTASISFDYQLAYEDILGSLAHVKMLEKCQILNASESLILSQGLKNIYRDIQQRKIYFSVSDEDIHMNIERLLLAEIGPTAGKLHTARSRNDQVTLDLHLYLRAHMLEIINQLTNLQQALLEQAEKNIDVIMPGYTHLQPAQPILFAHHLLAYCAMLQRDLQRCKENWLRINVSPLGAAALAGTSFPIDREYTAALLGFDEIYENSLDAVSDRDFVVEFLANAALLMAHLSRFSEELILWSSQEFGFIELDDAYCTGSSIMPQKKNPDVPELVRGKTGRVYGSLFNLLTILKGLPLAYNKDLQEDKEPVFDTVKTLHDILNIFPSLIATMRVRAENMLQGTQPGFINATELADYLVQKGLAFREAHEIVGKIVQYCIQQKLTLQNLSVVQLQKFSSLIDEKVYSILDMKNIVKAKNSFGGTSPMQVLKQIEKIGFKNSEMISWLQSKKILLQSVESKLLK